MPAMVAAIFFPKIIPVARRHGYAVALHGSLKRDIDIIAVPWVDSASDPEVLIAAIRKIFDDRVPTPSENKPHGRVAYTVATWAGIDVDISVTPRSSTS